MQNLPNQAGRDAPAPLSSPFAALAQPKIVFLAAGLLGLAIDLFVRPLSWVGFALIGLATAPWMFQAWSQRSALVRKEPAPIEPARPERPDQRIAAAPPGAAPARPEAAPTVMRETPRAAAAADPAARPPARPARASEPDPRTAAPRPPQARTDPARSPGAPIPGRPVRPETAR